MARLNLRLTDDLDALLKATSERTKVPVPALVREAITNAYIEHPQPLSFFFPRPDEYRSLSEFIGPSSDFLIAGATLGTLRREENKEFLLKKAEQHARMSFLLVHPSGPTSVLEVLAHTLLMDRDLVLEQIRETIRALQEVKESAGPYAQRVTIRGMRIFPTLGLTIVNLPSGEKRMRVNFYPIRPHPRLDPFLETDTLSSLGREVIAVFEEHYRSLDESARPIA